MIAITCLIDLYPASKVSSCLMIYKLEKLSCQWFQAKFSLSPPSGYSELRPPLMHLEFQTALPSKAKANQKMKIRQVQLLWGDVINLLSCCHRKNFVVLLRFRIIAFNDSHYVQK